MDFETTVGQITQSVREFRDHDTSSKLHRKRAIEAALHAGKYMVIAKSLVRHGDFMALLERLEVNDRTARRWAYLARSGVTADTVQRLGGIHATTRKLSECVSLVDGYDPEEDENDPESSWNTCPSCLAFREGRGVNGLWNFRDGRCRSHPMTPDEYRDDLDTVNWLPEIGQALNSKTVY